MGYEYSYRGKGVRSDGRSKNKLIGTDSQFGKNESTVKTKTNIRKIIDQLSEKILYTLWKAHQRLVLLLF